MTPERWQQLKTLAGTVSRLAAENRDGFLQQSCAEDLTARRGIEALAGFHEQETRNLPNQTVGSYTTCIGAPEPLSHERWQMVEQFFQSAIELEPEKRAAWLAQACRGDEALRQEVEALLVYQEAAGGMIAGAIQGAASLLAHDAAGFFEKARFAPGTLLAGRYRIVGLLGRGGMGEVYRADDLKLGQSVALKFLTEAMSQDRAMLARFHSEVRVARQVTHANICRVHDIGEVPTRQGTLHFLSMEYIDGEDLSSLLRRIGRLPADKAVEIANQLCAGLAAAHDAGILHRDLKPANVMIDGRGRVRITDFGLAGLAEQFRGQEVMAGTPAYMAPEQLAGREVTTRSDIYALGLVLYEIFTGRRVFEASSLDELRHLHESSAPTNPSLHVREIDPQVEKLILRCLEKDPARRPASAIQVAAALPGNDPLAAALAAGETPSPEIVAAATNEGALRPGVAVACLLTTVLVLGVLLWTAKSVTLHERVPLQKSPEVLAERARTLCQKFGYNDAPTDSAYGITQERNYWEYGFLAQAPAGFWQRIKSGQPLTLYFWYRQSPRYLVAKSFFMGDVSLPDPPADVPGMVSLSLDPRGRLVELQAVPPQIIEPASQSAAPDWASVFAEAGLDFTRFTSANPQWTPPNFADKQVAWQGRHPDHPDVPIRVEAASWQNRPVYFRIVAPWDKARRQEAGALSSRRQAGDILSTITWVAVLIGGLYLARRNLRAGRGDRKGGFRMALAIFLLSLGGMLLRAHHVPTSDELQILYEALSYALFQSFLAWMFYQALEPYVRRYWPRLLISWTRLLAGEVRNPMIGRDVLIGGMLGLIGHPLTIWGTRLLATRLGIEESPISTRNTLSFGGTRHVIAHFLSSLPEAVFDGLGCLLFLLLIYLLLRREWLATAAAWLLMYVILALLFTVSWSDRLLYLVQAAAVVVAVSRFGLLAVIVYMLFFALSFDYPLTLDFSRFYVSNGWFVIGVMLALSGGGFYISLGGQKVFAGKLPGEQLD
ncbi:MAG: serine/threonine-protein kinase [Blastocatellia bacterium]